MKGFLASNDRSDIACIKGYVDFRCNFVPFRSKNMIDNVCMAKVFLEKLLPNTLSS
jgi:hypothetical protein